MSGLGVLLGLIAVSVVVILIAGYFLVRGIE